MLANRQALVLGMVASIALFFSTTANADFDVITGWDKQLFPSYLVATATMKKNPAPTTDDEESTTDQSDSDSSDEPAQSDELSEDENAEEDESSEEGTTEESEEVSQVEILGNADGPLGVIIEAPEDDTWVEVEIEAPGILEPSRWAGWLSSAGTEYTIYPPMKFNYKALVANKQVIPVPVTYRVTLGDDEPEEHTETLTLRSINDCPFAIVWDEQHGQDVSFMFAAYVNEQHPFVDKVLREALNRGIVDSFTGYQSGNPETVYKQVYAIWDALSQRDVRYSNITASAADSQIVRSQHVRLIDESINNAQANCVDGSVLLASVLRKIDIQPALVFVPGHCYLAFALDPDGKEWAGLETTLLGTPLGESPDLIELNKIVAEPWDKERSWGTFRSAVAVGGKDLSDKKEKFADPNDARHRVISIAAARQMGILPIAFDSSETFLSSSEGSK
jgi:hypothetical protein